MASKKVEKEWIGYRLQLLSSDGTAEPEARQGHILVELSGTSNRYFLFGGRGNSKAKPWKDQTKQERQQGKQRRYLHDAWILTLHENCAKWQEILSSDGPGPRWSAASFVYENAVYVHGGRSVDGFLDDVWRFCLQEKRWERVETKGHAPPPVNGHCLVRYDDKAYFFGGSCSFGRDREYLGDTYVLDLNSFQWTHISITPHPSPRYWHSTTPAAFPDGCFYLVDGFVFTQDGNECYYDDVWRFDFDQHMWTQIALPEAEFHRRNRCGVALVGSSNLVVFGGNYFGSKRRYVFMSSVSLINTDQQTASELRCVEGKPRPLGHHSFLKVPNDNTKFLIFGGEDGKHRFNDVLIMSLVES